MLQPQAYETEAVLQRLLAEYPEVLAGRRTGGDSTTKLLLIRQEMGVPKEEGGGAHWSADHFFVASDAVPVIVEVKRRSDTRIRREVIGQMLDYAANGVRYWPDPRVIFEEGANKAKLDSDQLLSDFDPNLDPDVFWSDVTANLRSGHIRMVFVADELPLELIRIIEFLNEQMREAEVLGVEVRQYVSHGTTLLVPRVFGKTTEAVASKQGATGTPWNESSFVEVAQEWSTEVEFASISKLLAHANEYGDLRWGHGATPGVAAWYRVDGKPVSVWALYPRRGEATRPYLNLSLPSIGSVGDARRSALVALLKAIPALSAPVAHTEAQGFKGPGSYAAIYLADLAPDIDQFIASLQEWIS